MCIMMPPAGTSGKPTVYAPAERVHPPAGGGVRRILHLNYRAQESFKVTARLNTGAPGLESTRSATK